MEKEKAEEELSLIDEGEIKIELEKIKAKEVECRAEIDKLLKAEDFKAGIYFPNEIHELKQKRMDLQFRITFYEARLKRMAAFE